MKTIKYILNILLILLCVVLQTGFLSGFKFLSNLDMVLCFIVFFVLFDYSLALLWVFVGGFLLSFYSVFPFGTHVVIFLTVTFILKYLLKNFFSHRSLYALVALIIMGFIIYHIELLIITNIFYWLKIIDLHTILDKIYLIDVVNYIILNTFITSILVFIFGFQRQKKLSL